MQVYRAWINQPSKLQRYNFLHGVRVIVIETVGRITVCPTSGDWVEFDIPDRLPLSPGWADENGLVSCDSAKFPPSL
jgi:hypothetical protein